MLQKIIRVMPGLRKYRTVPKLSRLLCSVIHPSAPAPPLFPPRSVVHSARIKTVSDTCHMSGSVPGASNDPVPLYPVTLQWHSVCPRQSLPLSPSCPPPFSASVLPSLRTLLFLLLPTPSFTIHILETFMSMKASAHVCISTIFSAQETYIFLLEPSPLPLLFLIQLI